MNLQLPIQIDKPAFLAWVQGREERYELTEGRVVMMVERPSPRRDRQQSVVLLRGQLDPQQWTVIADFGLDAGPTTLRYPDVVVNRAGGSASDFVARAPILLAEVLSPSTAEIDLGDKAAEYLRLPSLQAYLVFAQSGFKAYVWARRGTNSDRHPA